MISLPGWFSKKKKKKKPIVSRGRFAILNVIISLYIRNTARLWARIVGNKRAIPLSLDIHITYSFVISFGL